MEKFTKLLNSWWINIASTGVLFIALLSYGYKLYAGVALGWALCTLIKSLKKEEVKPTKKKAVAKKPTAKKPTAKKKVAKKPVAKK